MDHRERFVRTLTGQEVDRVPFMKVFGGTNAVLPRWEEEYPGIGEVIDEMLEFEGPYRGWQIVPVNFGLSSIGPPKEVRKESGEVIYTWDDGTVQISLPHGDFHVQTIGWPVKDRDDWERLKTRRLDPDDPERYPADWSKYVREFASRDYPLQLTHGGVYGFARNVMGDERLAYMFYDDPELVHDAMDSYTDFVIKVWERLTEEVEFDLIEFWEDMASKNGSLISPATFREFMKPNYLKVAEFARAHGIKVILVDSDGYVEKLAELQVESGVNASYPFEVLAGNDVAKALDARPSLGIIGGLDKNVMSMGKAEMDAEIERGRELVRKGRFIPGPDHFALSNVPFENYKYFMNRMKEMVFGTKPGT